LAYRFAVEDSICIDLAATGRGYGAALLEAVNERCAALDKRQLISVITGSTTAPSLGLHIRLGFRVAGCKLAKWANAVLMTRPLCDGYATPPV
tara:strand:+ start:303 stop:581 length:279 start_codon:yes stop_codon:yes gene_type:complete